jgi:glycosyltransferase involved in cell wall biosynthesis
MRLLFHAPNVNTGGGLRLLRDVLSVAPSPIAWAQLDRRTGSADLPLPAVPVHLVANTLLSRLAAEWRLRRECRAVDVALCFHGLPPLFPLRGSTVVFVQNCLLIDRDGLRGYPTPVRFRIALERLWFAALQNSCSRYIVQTPTMAIKLKRYLRRPAEIIVSPFAGVDEPAGFAGVSPTADQVDFVYVASGEAHKNHMALLEAWELLAETGLYPSLALTLDSRADTELCERIRQRADIRQLAISICGPLPAEGIQRLYGRARALIYPSLKESFGLPLIEAARAGLPIIASERDYVRDVVVPVQTFDPSSPRSIARAVRRFLGKADPAIELGTAGAFLSDTMA